MILQRKQHFLKKSIEKNRGNSTMRWIDGVEVDARKVEATNWVLLAKVRDQ